MRCFAFILSYDAATESREHRKETSDKVRKSIYPWKNEVILNVERIVVVSAMKNMSNFEREQ